MSSNDKWKLRDWLAGQALAGMGTWSPGFACVDEAGRPVTGDECQRRRMALRARFAYAQADAMLAARTNGGDDA